jgi:glycosyltransferase involved in cell wall biosynthesis
MTLQRFKMIQITSGSEIWGAERHFWNLLNGLDKEKYKIIVISPPGNLAKKLREQGVALIKVKMRHKADLFALISLFYHIKKVRPHIVHTHDNRANLFGRIAARAASVPIIISTVHTLPTKREHVGNLLNRFYCLLDRFTTSFVDKVIAVSKIIEGELVNGLKVPPHKVTLIWNGIDTKKFNGNLDKESKRKVCERLGIEPTSPIVGTVGRLSQEKGHRYFLEAAKEIAKMRPDVRFLIVGKGEMEPELKEMVRRLGLDEKVTFTGYIENIEEITSIMDVVVLASLREGFGMAASEALASGKPVVATTSVGCLRDVGYNGKVGFLVPPGDPKSISKGVLDILDNPVRAERMGVQGRSLVKEKYNVEEMLKKTHLLYQELIEEKGLWVKKRD